MTRIDDLLDHGNKNWLHEWTDLPDLPPVKLTKRERATYSQLEPEDARMMVQLKLAHRNLRYFGSSPASAPNNARPEPTTGVLDD